jgi:hypothetical protein
MYITSSTRSTVFTRLTQKLSIDEDNAHQVSVTGYGMGSDMRLLHDAYPRLPSQVNSVNQHEHCDTSQVYSVHS